MSTPPIGGGSFSLPLLESMMNLVERVKGILLNPKKEWPIIDVESATVGSIYTQYVIPLAAIPAVAGFVGSSVLGYGFFGASIRLPMGTGLMMAAVQYIGALIAVYVIAVVADALAPTFGGQKNQIQALKLAAYSSTAAWIAGIFMLVPGLRFLNILGLYSIYLLFLGVPVLMKAPEDKAVGYTAGIAITALILYVIIGTVASRAIGGYAWLGF
jgi:hypothetical protein